MVGRANASPPITYASREHTRAPCVYAASHVPVFRADRHLFGFDIAWPPWARADAYDVIDVPSISEPHGPHGTVANRGRGGAQISQPRAARRLRQGVRPPLRSARTDLAHLAHLHPAGLWH